MKTDDKDILEQANKLIFVKKYEAARQSIERLLTRDEVKKDLLVHLRRIELGVKLGELPRLKEKYLEYVLKHPDAIVEKISLIFVEQHGEMIEANEAVARFQDVLRTHPDHPAAYYGIAYSMEVLGNMERAAFNYEQCLKFDPGWYPASFGLSQIYYQLGEDQKGDYYFYLFEEAAPYNVYGNFDTHRKLANEFLEHNAFEEAEVAITTLSEWWTENKGSCPLEIQIYEYYSIARIAEHKHDRDRSNYKRMQANTIADQLLKSTNVAEGVLYFVAKTLEEFSEFELAFQFYKKILSVAGSNSHIVQKIGGQFLSLGEYKLAKELFDEAYKHHPDNPEIRFCQLIANLKLGSVDVEDYLVGKERMKQLIQHPTDKVELLSLLHSLLAKYGDDPDVHSNLAEIHLKLGNHERAAQHFRRMYELDRLSMVTSLRYAAFEMQFGDPELANETLDPISDPDGLSHNDLLEYYWLKTNYLTKKGDYHKARQHLVKILQMDPWNVSYLVHEIILLTAMANLDAELKVHDQVVESLSHNEESNLNWTEFETRTRELERKHLYDLVYVREKLRFLYAEGSELSLRHLVQAACKFDAKRCTFDFLRLLNTNFDSPSIYWALGTLFKELWQLETASVWYEQILLYPVQEESQKSRAYLELADCYIWRGLNLSKAIEYVKIAMDLGNRGDGRAMTIMAHAYLRLGQVRQAQLYLEDAEEKADPEAIYLKGLVFYRNGALQRANEIWKPLLTVRSENLRFHNIKQEILKYYFDKVPYLNAN